MLTKEQIKKELHKEEEPMDLNALGGYIMKVFFTYRDITHYWHFQTTSEATHSTLNDFYDDYLDAMDDLIEQFTMAYGRIRTPDITITVPTMVDEQAPKLLMDEIYLAVSKLLTAQQIKCRPDLKSQVRKILKLVAKTGYKLTLN